MIDSFTKMSLTSFGKKMDCLVSSVTANSIKVELYSDDEPGQGGEEDGGEDGGPDHGGDAGGAYRELSHVDAMTAGATRLPNGKLKCDICGMICIGPNVLMVHKRSHTGDPRPSLLLLHRALPLHGEPFHLLKRELGCC